MRPKMRALSRAAALRAPAEILDTLESFDVLGGATY
jgi:hypothetical protein